MRPRLIAHRGASLVAPENTFEAANAALDLGADIIELDVRESADGVLYVLHDRTVDRTTDGAGLLELMHSADIDALDAGRWFAPEFCGAKVPRLDAFLDNLRARGAGAYVELKWCNPDTLAGTLRETCMMEHSFAFAHKPEMAIGLASAAPDLRTSILLSVARNVSVARSLYRADIIELEEAECTDAVVRAARAAGLEVIGYSESSTPAVFKSFADTHVDYINLDHLEVALKVLGENP
ncbi:glycerophosphodiester phosphodiesterase [Roseibium sp.]|uniref:glycerophosphodiester phosphodiesterase n=1 Tax=Roseibium sp. TaxID=1936156 RepID=UPI003BA9A8AD